MTRASNVARPRSRRKAVASPRSTLAGDLRVRGLPVLEADLLRDHLARVGVHVDTEEDETDVRIRAGENRDLTVESVLALVERWARDEHFTELPIEYGDRPYRLVTAPAARTTRGE